MRDWTAAAAAAAAAVAAAAAAAAAAVAAVAEDKGNCMFIFKGLVEERVSLSRK